MYLNGNINTIDVSTFVPVVPGSIIYTFWLFYLKLMLHVQFGTDQLQFASNEELSKFVH